MLRRPRRLRATQALRNLVRETKLEKEDLDNIKTSLKN